MKAWQYAATTSHRNGATIMANGESVDILVVESNKSERDSLVSALQAAVPHVRVKSVGTGEQALDFLFGRGVWTSRAGDEPPRLILLDLENPGVSARSVLAQIRAMEPRDALTLTPVVVFTDSGAKEDIQRSYRTGANSYVMKPVSFSDFQTVVEKIGQYWMTHNLASS